MKQSLDAARGLKPEVRRRFHAHIEAALKLLEAYPEKNAEGLHEARKHIKKLRAWLRLLRHPKFNNTRRQLNAELRDCARLVSARRDSEVLQSCFLQWYQDLPADTNPRLKKALLRIQLASTAPAIPPSDHQLSPECRALYATKIQAVDARFQKTALGPLSEKPLRQQLARTHQRVKKAYRKFETKDTPTNLHNLRKCNKDLSYQLRFLKNIAPQAKALFPQIKNAEDALSRARDYDLALHAVDATAATQLSSRERQTLLVFIANERRRWIDRARAHLEPQL